MHNDRLVLAIRSKAKERKKALLAQARLGK